MSSAVHQTRVLTIVFTDLVSSTDFNVELGDDRAEALFARHRTFVLDNVAELRGRVIKWLGDGFLLAFETPSEAIVCGLRLILFHHAAPELPRVRVGMHLGEVVEGENPCGPPGSVELRGLAVSLASRIESLAIPGQILMSSMVFSSARQYVTEEDLDATPVWLTHGLYRLKGYDQDVEICEVGIRGVSPLEPPRGAAKATRAGLLADEILLGWRPATGLPVPKREEWVLANKVGDGPSGEVWSARRRGTDVVRAFKFCFDAKRLQILEKESNLILTLQEVLGEESGVVRLHGASLDSPPYFLEMDYATGGNLATWAESRGGLDQIPLASRIERVAEIADALDAAHSAGVVHKNIKPSNVLIEHREDSTPRAILADLGIAQLLDHASLAAAGIRSEGFTERATDILSGQIPRTGTRLYMAPEILARKKPTAKSDLYALGVLLYQLAVGDLNRPLAHGWERDIRDDQLKDDIAACVDGDPDRRLPSARELAQRLHAYVQHEAQNGTMSIVSETVEGSSEPTLSLGERQHRELS